MASDPLRTQASPSTRERGDARTKGGPSPVPDQRKLAGKFGRGRKREGQALNLTIASIHGVARKLGHRVIWFDFRDSCASSARLDVDAEGRAKP